MKTNLFGFIAFILFFISAWEIAQADSIEGYASKYYPLFKANEYEGAPVLVK